jgi:hypothetical protein
VGEDSVSRNEHNEYLFHHLVAMFQTLALQQLGKLVNPITGKLERDLQQAKITIDMLQMLKNRTTGNLEQSEQMILDRALLELQMNFVDEKQRPEEEQPDEAGEFSGSEKKDNEEAEQIAADTDDGEGFVADVEKETDAAEDAPSADKGKAKAKTTKRKSGKKKKTD